MKKTALQINLRRLMGNKKISEGKLSRETGVSQTTIHRILTGEIRESKPSTVQPLADYFDTTIAELSNYEADGNVKPKTTRGALRVSLKMEKIIKQQLILIQNEIARIRE